ncbi:MAG: HAD-IA family hydrolase [Gammaproteobacteria bacterium]|nr:HAD-IA family hydrolase [Gammaproteobacteria bacterium]MDH5728379.1 HAD-IA family hydrolase [Gammaproteobacteria bacterium]
MSKPYKLLVFDWDGTLMDSQAEIISCFQSAAKDLAREVPSTAAIRDIIGLGMKEAIMQLFPGISEETDVQEVIAAYRHHYFSEDKISSELFNGIMTMFEQLAEQDVFLAVATSKGRRGLDLALQRTGLNTVFHVTRCIDEAQSKPHPQMLLDIIDYTGVDARETLMIGDTEYDLLMARNAASDGLGVCCGAHERQRLLACEPVACLEHTTDIVHWLANK